MIWYDLEFQGRTVRVPAVKSQGKLWFHWHGQTYVLESEKSQRKGGGEKSSARPGVIVAPMPGKITRVAVVKGDHVKRGQALIVMEAMKMEYTLQADKDGVVAEVNAQVGAQVALGSTLVKLEERK